MYIKRIKKLYINLKKKQFSKVLKSNKKIKKYILAPLVYIYIYQMRVCINERTYKHYLLSYQELEDKVLKLAGSFLYSLPRN